MFRRSLGIVLAISSVLLCAHNASALGRRGGFCHSISYCCSPCIPCYPTLCHPYFAFNAHLKNPSGYVDPGQPLPIEVGVTSYECYWWEYFQSDYGFYVFDEQGHYIPNALHLPYLFREIWVRPGVTTLDEPRGIRLNMGVLQLGKRYSLLVTLKGHCSWLHFIPFLEETKKETSAASPATIVVTLPEDAKLTIDDEPTVSTSGRRVFTTPALAEGTDYTYTLKAEVIRDGKIQSIARRVTVHAGKETQVSIEIPSATVAAN
jgi:uncharacterized protein (TIGR03000 family)